MKKTLIVFSLAILLLGSISFAETDNVGGIIIEKDYDATNSSIVIYSICVVKSDDSLHVDTLCNVVPNYSLLNGNGEVLMEDVPVGMISRGCIDLTSPTIPVIRRDACTLGPGRYFLTATVGEKSINLTFKINGELDIASRDAIAIDTNGKTIPGSSYKFKRAAMGGEIVPLYISTIADPCQGDVACGKPLEMDPASASGLAYLLDADPGLTVYVMNAAGQLEVLPAGSMRTIGAAGVDTVYVTAALIGMMQNPTVYNIGVAGRAKAAITFFAPTILFMGDETITTLTLSGDPDTYERWEETYYDFYLAAYKPNADGTMSFCEECNFPLFLGAMTSPGIELLTDSIFIVNGRGLISVRSMTDYRTNDNPAMRNPATIHITGENPNLTSAMYKPVYFRSPPAPTPLFADAFDVRGKKTSNRVNIPSPFFDTEQEYLDGIADSVAIYYSRHLHKDSLPTICIAWDSSSAQIHNPYKEGLSIYSEDTLIFCNALVEVESKNMGCVKKSESGLCSNVIKIGNLKLSKEIKTSGNGTIISYDKRNKYGFNAIIYDRIAPILLRAELYPKNKENIDVLVLVMSEPTTLNDVEHKANALDFYLNSASKQKKPNQFTNLLTDSPSIVIKQGETNPYSTKKSANNQEYYVSFIYVRGETFPQEGDYVRLAANSEQIIWTDTAKYAIPWNDSLRYKKDEDYYWNAPTSYNSFERLPSPWVPITTFGEEGFAPPSFRIEMTGPFTFKIVFDKDSRRTKKYAVMDLMGGIVEQGETGSMEASVNLRNAGSYIVRVGHKSTVVNVNKAEEK